jgi:SAM-dependent methyltransferase
MRAVMSFLRQHRSAVIYLTEQTTLLYRHLTQRFQSIVGSEYLRDGCTARGATNEAGIRHEDITQLTFGNDKFDVIASFDVLEHVPHYCEALKEFHRSLKSNGSLLLTVPLDLSRNRTVTRARVREGTIEHLLPPEYHGDPLSTEGVLCFYTFGWDLLDALSDAGFRDGQLVFYWSKRLGHLGGLQFVITATKG